MKIPFPLKSALLGVTLAVGSLNATAATYKLNVWAPGVRAPLAANPSPPTSGGTAVGLLEPVASADFGGVRVGQVALRSFRFTNTGDGSANDVRAVVGNPDLSIASSSCGTTGALVTIAPGASCAIEVAFAPSSAGPLQSTLAIGGVYSNSPSALSLTGQGIADAVGTLQAVTTGDFGTVPVGSSVARSFTFRNTGNLAATNIAAQVPTVTGLSVSSNSCGTAAAPVTVAAGASCSISLAYGGSTASKLASASLQVVGNFTGAPASLALTGSIGSFDAAGTWSTSYNSVVAPSGAFSFGTRTTGSSAALVKTIFLRNTGTSGSLAASYRLTGDTQHFTITGLVRHNASGSTEYACQGAIAANQLSVAECVAGSSTEQLSLSIGYTPKSSGAHRVSLVPLSSNGTALPAPLEVTGTGDYNPAAVWSTSYNSVVAPASSTIVYGDRSQNSSTTKSVFMRNSGNYGAMALGFTLTGDISHFRITRIVQLNNSGSSENSTCALGDGKTTPICSAQDPSQASFVQLGVNVEYAPTALGSHSVTLTPNTNNGTVLPAPITLTGQAIFNATATWTSSYTGVVAFTPAALSFGSKTLNSTTAKNVFVRNVGTNGSMAVAFTLSGDVTQFKLRSIGYLTPSGNGSGGCSVGTGQPTAMCLGTDPAAGGYPNLHMIFDYVPTVAGSHSLTVTPSTNNGTALQAPIVLTGSAQ